MISSNYITMKKFEKINAGKFQTLENEEMGTLKGGRALAVTLDTVTIDSCGCVSNDGDDSYDGE